VWVCAVCCVLCFITRGQDQVSWLVSGLCVCVACVCVWCVLCVIYLLCLSVIYMFVCVCVCGCASMNVHFVCVCVCCVRLWSCLFSSHSLPRLALPEMSVGFGFSVCFVCCVFVRVVYAACCVCVRRDTYMQATNVRMCVCICGCVRCVETVCCASERGVVSCMCVCGWVCMRAGCLVCA